MNYNEFMKWMREQHPDITLTPIQEQFSKHVLSERFNTEAFWWPPGAGKTTILKLLYEFTTEGESMPQDLSYEVAEDKSWIKCLGCGKTSYHTMDVTHLYCGYCHKFHK